jgi:hypothetical protein
LASINAGARPLQSHAMLSVLANSVAEQIESGAYFTAVLEHLIYQVCDAPLGSITFEALRYTTRSVIFSFVSAGFSVEALKWYPGRLCSGYAVARRRAAPRFFSEMRFDRELYDLADKKGAR